MQKYIEALLPGTTSLQRRDPSISPFFADIRGKKLPPALFTCGSEDPLLDDSVFMGAKWQVSCNLTSIIWKTWVMVIDRADFMIGLGEWGGGEDL